MRNIATFLCLAVIGGASAAPAPAERFVFPDERRDRKLEPITPPKLPVLEHLEHAPGTSLPHERRASFQGNNAPTFQGNNSPTFKRSGSSSPGVKPRFGFGGSYNVAPSPGGLTASVSSSASGAGVSHAASQSFSFGVNGASHSASQASSFNGFGSGFSGSQASSQAGSFGAGGGGASGAASQAASFGGGSGGGSQSASSAFGFNSNGFQHEPTFGEGVIDLRHRGVPDFPSFPKFPQPQLFPNFFGKGNGIGAAAFRSGKPSQRSKDDDFLTIIVSD